MDKTRAFYNAYAICVKRRNLGKDHPNYLDKNKCNLDINGNIHFDDLKKNFKVDVYNVLEDFFKKYLKEYKDLDVITNAKDDKKSYVKFKAQNIKEDTTRKMWGEIRSGASGYPSDIAKFGSDPKTKKVVEQVNYSVSSDEHDLLDFFFEFYTPAKGYRGTIIFLSLGVRGVVTPIKKALAKYFIDNDLGFKIEISPLLMKLKKNKSQTRVRKIKRITRPKLDVEDQVKKKSRRKDKTSNIKMTSTITGFDENSFDWEKFLPKKNAQKIKQMKSYFKEFYEIDDDKFTNEYEVEIKTDNRSRTIVIQENIQMSMSFDITSDLKKDENGKYTEDSLKSEADKIINDIDKGHL